MLSQSYEDNNKLRINIESLNQKIHAQDKTINFLKKDQAEKMKQPPI